MTFHQILHIEFIKLFRRSNILFFFLMIYVLNSPVFRATGAVREQPMMLSSAFFEILTDSVAIFGMLLLAIFLVNSIGNEFNEGSYRKSIAAGLKKSSFFYGKLFLILMPTLLIIFLVLLAYALFGIFAYDYSISNLFKGINVIKTLHAGIALYYAGLLGLFFISVFRNRTIGLVFFPFWTITEFFLYAFSHTERINIPHDFLPGAAGWQLFTSNGFEPKYLAIVALYSAICIIASFWALRLREEK